MNYETIIGLEIHVELSTQSKMFCRCKNPTLTDRPNSNTCPVCLGLPGALPYTNQQAIEACVKIALALGCEINKDSFFERKNYFYPDLAKGFQTSQYLHPFGEHGRLEIETNGVKKTIGITRVHMEEDTGKLTHSTVNGKNVSLIDFNRSGVPLVEIVTEPDIRSGEEAKEFLIKLQRIIRYLNVSDADMEKGHMRLEPNISLREINTTNATNTTNNPIELPKYKVEVKNINSFKFVDKAIKFEQKRHKELLSKGETPIQETRGWNEFKNKTVSQRSKEEAHDYRYFPEPDIPLISFTKDQISKIKKQIGELPEEKLGRFIKDYGIKPYDAEILTRGKKLADFFDDAVKVGKEHDISPSKIASFIINKSQNIEDTMPVSLIKQIVERDVIEEIDEDRLSRVIEEALKQNPKAVEDYNSGKVQILGFLIGQVRSALPEAKDTNQIRNIILKMLE
jgi:aspartyl-tRNA(Asn)/glutamyl-tRNA(Gln) amidotransferase subunit B